MRIFYEQKSFTRGEGPVDLDARADVDIYHKAGKQLTNLIVSPIGNIYKRPGFRVLAQYKDRPPIRMIPFIFSDVSQYILIFYYRNTQDIAIDVYSPSNDIGDLELVATIPGPNQQLIGGYPAQYWQEMRYAQAFDYMYFTHPDYQLVELVRGQTDSDWTLNKITLVNPPFDSYDTETLLSTSGRIRFGGTLTVTATNPVFQDVETRRISGNRITRPGWKMKLPIGNEGGIVVETTRHLHNSKIEVIILTHIPTAIDTEVGNPASIGTSPPPTGGPVGSDQANNDRTCPVGFTFSGYDSNGSKICRNQGNAPN